MKKPSGARATGKDAGKDKARDETQGKDRYMGAALRTVYQKTVDEAIPAEMLDLLGKLD